MPISRKTNSSLKFHVGLPDALLCAALAGCVSGAFAQSVANSVAGQTATPPAPQTTGALPDFRQLEAAGATIGRIDIKPQNIFDMDQSEENNAVFRFVNKLHFPTRPDVIQRVLLFKSGDRISVQKIDESERLLRSTSTLYEADIRVVAVHDGVADVEVITKDTWSLDVNANFSRSGGDNKSSFGLTEKNLLGTGLNIGFAHTSDIDRAGTRFEASYNQAFDGHTAIAAQSGRFDDGRRSSFVIDRPFFSLDARYTAHGGWGDDDRIDPIYNSGEIISEYRHRIKTAEVSGGWSPGLQQGWVQRYSAGAVLQDNFYSLEPGRIAPTLLPISNDMRGVFLRFQLLEDRYSKVKNHNLIERTEYLPLGFNVQAQVTRSLTGLGADRADWLYKATINDGFVPSTGQTVLTSAAAERRIASTAQPMNQLGFSVKYYFQPTSQSLWYATVAADRVRGGGAADQLLIGGDAGLRGYPSRYQAGEQRMLISMERRLYANWYPFRLFHIGGAVFADAGRAWGGLNQNTLNNGWLTDAGVGLRIALDRAAFANVLHLDVAAPLNRAGTIKPVQFLVKTEFAF